MKQLTLVLEAIVLFLTLRNKAFFYDKVREIEERCERLEQEYYRLYNSGNRDGAERLRKQRSKELLYLNGLSTSFYGASARLNNTDKEGDLQSSER